MANRIQADYDRLASAAASFAHESETATRLFSQVKQLVEQLQGGAWIGAGAESFFQEMNELVLPGVSRLINALRDAGGASKRIAEALRQAEEECARLFQGEAILETSPRPGVASAPTVGENDAGERLANDFYDNRRAPYVLNAGVPVMDYPFASGAADALKYSIKIGDQSIDVYFPVNRDPAIGHFHTMKQIADGLSMLPEANRIHIKHIQVEPGRNPDDPKYAIKFNKPNFRSYMDAGPKGIIRIFPSRSPIGQAFLDTSFLHETSHILSKRMWGTDPTRSSGWAQWEAAKRQDGTSVSGYGNQDIQEDFSETVVQYSIYKGGWYDSQARRLWGNRFKILDEIFR